MNHLTDETLNEYLDDELTNRVEIEQHLSRCADCAARLTALQALFNEIESLPELALSKPLAAPFTRREAGFVLPHWLKLTATLQAAVVLVIIILTAPFIAELLPTIQTPSLADTLLQLQSQWTAWLALLSAFQLPTSPTFPTPEISSLVLTLILAGVSVLWLVGNGLLLRNQIK
jgi:anti-sigma factor RsiW